MDGGDGSSEEGWAACGSCSAGGVGVRPKLAGRAVRRALKYRPNGE